MGIEIGSSGYGETSFVKAYLGDTAVDKIYLGTTAVWTASGGGGGGGGGGGSSSYSISLVSDDSGYGSSSGMAVIQLTTLPSGATGYKVAMSGYDEVNSQAYTGVLVYIPNPGDGVQYDADQGSPSSTGPQNMNNQVTYRDSTKRLEIYPGASNAQNSVSVTVTPINLSNTEIGGASNTITGIEIA